MAFNIINRRVKIQALTKNVYQFSKYCTGNSKDLNDQELKEKKKLKSEQAAEKLNTLLERIIKEEKQPLKSESKKFAQPQKSQKKPKIHEEKNIESIESEQIEKKIIDAAKTVAKHIGRDVKQTESELISKLLNTSKKESSGYNLNDLITNMKVDHQTERKTETTRAHQVKQALRETEHQRGPRNKFTMKYKRPQPIDPQRIDIFGSEPLKIFKPTSAEGETTELTTWKHLQSTELRLAVTHPPGNHFQQMILWTEQGKLWKFPIDNEQGLEEEQNVCFSEHIFLEQHLDPWCPKKGPIRHFMELVCVGLSKNYYLTVSEKKSHIEWFKTYFDSKKQLLQDTGAIPLNAEVKSLQDQTPTS